MTSARTKGSVFFFVRVRVRRWHRKKIEINSEIQPSPFDVSPFVSWGSVFPISVSSSPLHRLLAKIGTSLLERADRMEGGLCPIDEAIHKGKKRCLG